MNEDKSLPNAKRLYGIIGVFFVLLGGLAAPGPLPWKIGVALVGLFCWALVMSMSAWDEDHFGNLFVDWRIPAGAIVPLVGAVSGYLVLEWFWAVSPVLWIAAMLVLGWSALIALIRMRK